MKRMTIEEIKKAVKIARATDQEITVEEAQTTVAGTYRCDHITFDRGFYLTTDEDDPDAEHFYGPIYWHDIVCVRIGE